MEKWPQDNSKFTFIANIFPREYLEKNKKYFCLCSVTNIKVSEICNIAKGAFGKYLCIFQFLVLVFSVYRYIMILCMAVLLCMGKMT
jgi:hypothetical protein